MPPADAVPVAPKPDIAAPPLTSRMPFDLRELTTTVIALMIVGVTLFALGRSFVSGEGSDVQKDLLAIALSLLGTVTGYYFGRVPSELRAESAEATAQKVHADAQETKQMARTAIDDAVDALQTSEPDSTRAIGGPKQALTQLKAIRNRL